MTLTLRSASTSVATTKGAALTHAEMDANWLHALQSANTEFLQSGSGASATTVQDYLRSKKIILGWIPTNLWAGIAAGTNTDDLSTYVDNAVTDAAGAAIYWPAGTYYCNVLDLPSNTHFYGDGEATIIRPYDTTAKGALGCASGSSSSFITGLTLRNLKFLGIGTFSEHAHLVILSGAKRARIENCYFVDFRGDGLLLASSHNGATEEHNVDITVRGCVFDGVDNDTRNGMSVIDVDGLDVDDCTFRNCAKSDMPGSLDFEPDQSYSVIKNVRVHHSHFYNTDGNRGHVVLATDNTTSVENITIDHNHFEDVPVNSAAVLLNTSTSAPATPLRIIIDSNTIDCTGSHGIYKRDGAADGLVIKGNVITALNCVRLTYAGAETTSRNIEIEGNIIYGEATASAITINEIIVDTGIKGNLFKGTPTNHILIAGTSSTGVSIVGNAFVGTPATRVITHTSTTTNPVTNVLLGNRFEAGALCSFAASRNDYCGSFANPTGADETTAPNGFTPGVHRSRLSARTIDGVSQTGVLETHVLNAALTSVWQRFIPDYGTTYKNIEYIRKASSTTTWDSWWRHVGTSGPSVNTTAVGNVGGGTDDLMTYSLPANTLSVAGKGVRVTAWGTTANNANPKTVTLAFGATTILTTALTVSQAGVWRITAEVFSTGTDTQQTNAQLLQGGTTTLVDVEQGTAAIDDGAAITIKCTGTVTDGGGGINNDDIVQKGMLVEHIL